MGALPRLPDRPLTSVEQTGWGKLPQGSYRRQADDKSPGSQPPFIQARLLLLPHRGLNSEAISVRKFSHFGPSTKAQHRYHLLCEYQIGEL